MCEVFNVQMPTQFAYANTLSVFMWMMHHQRIYFIFCFKKKKISELQHRLGNKLPDVLLEFYTFIM